MAFTWGNSNHYRQFPVNPTQYTVPNIKNSSFSYSIDGTLVVSSPYYKQNEFNLIWNNVNDDMDSIVSYIYDTVEHAMRLNNANNGCMLFDDGLGIFSGNATLISFDISTRATGNDKIYSITLTFKLN